MQLSLAQHQSSVKGCMTMPVQMAAKSHVIYRVYFREMGRQRCEGEASCNSGSDDMYCRDLDPLQSAVLIDRQLTKSIATKSMPRPECRLPGTYGVYQDK